MNMQNMNTEPKPTPPPKNAIPSLTEVARSLADLSQALQQQCDALLASWPARLNGLAEQLERSSQGEADAHARWKEAFGQFLTQVVALEQQVSTLVGQVKALESLLPGLDGKLGTLSGRVETLTAKVTDLTQRIGAHEAEMQAQRQLCAQVIQESNEMKHQYLQLHSTIEALKDSAK